MPVIWDAVLFPKNVEKNVEKILSKNYNIKTKYHCFKVIPILINKKFNNYLIDKIYSNKILTIIYYLF